MIEEAQTFPALQEIGRNTFILLTRPQLAGFTPSGLPLPQSLGPAGGNQEESHKSPQMASEERYEGWATFHRPPERLKKFVLKTTLN